MAHFSGIVGMFTLAVGLSACTTAGPNYRPSEHSAATIQSATGAFVAAGTNTTQAELPDHWWQLYADPKLDNLVMQALTSNADLRTADENLRKASAVLSEARGARSIFTIVSGGLNASGTGADLSSQASYDIGLSANYPLDLHGKISRAIEAAKANAEATAAARDSVQIAVAAATAKAYVDICAANYSLSVNQKIVTLQRDTLSATKRLQEGGRGTGFDVSRAQAAVDQSEARLPAFIAQRQINLYLLATLIGKSPAEYPIDIAECMAIPTLAQPMPIGDGAELIRRRPDIRAAERKIAADTGLIGVATADLYPAISLGGSVGLGGLVKDAGSQASFGFSLGPLLSWTTPNRPRVLAQIAQADAQVGADLSNFDSITLEALRQTETALETYRRTGETLTALEKSRDSASVSADQAEHLFHLGRGDFLSLLDAQRSLAKAEAASAAASNQFADAQISVFLALGGGWQREQE